ncbi:MAG: AAA family ATPase [Marmoricola sp.]
MQPPALVERGEQLEAVRQAAMRAASGAGEVVVIEAAAGMGKTSLLASCAPALDDLGLLRLQARAVEQERTFAFGVVQTLLGRVVDEQNLEGSARSALGVFQPTPGEPEHSQAQVFYGLYWLIANVSQRQPLALIVDDLHEADDASLAFLAYLSTRITDLPVLLVLATRPADQVGRRPLLDVLRSPQPITLPALTRAGVAGIVADLLDDSSADLVDACRDASGGNPFYLRELVRDLDRYPVDERSEVVEGLAPKAIVRSVVMNLGRLEPGAVAVAQACAVLGDGTSLSRVAQLADLDLTTTARLADALADAGVLAHEPVPSFTHPILHSAILHDIGDNQLGVLHLRAAHVVRDDGGNPQQIAAHLLHSPPHGSTETVDLLRIAATAASRSGGPAAAATYLARALAEPPNEEVYGDVLFDLGLAEAALAQPGALNHLEPSLEWTRDAETRAQRALVIAELCRKIDQGREGIAVLDRSLADDLSPETNARLRLERHWIARTHLTTVELSAPGLEELLPAYQQPDGPLRRIAAAHLAIEAAIATGQEAGAAYLREALAEPGLLTSATPDSSPVGSLELAMVVTEQHKSFARFADEVAERAAREGNVIAAVWLATNRSIEMVRLGQLAEAEAECEAALALSAAHGWPPGSPELHAMLAETLLEQGRIPEARQVVAAAPYAVDAPQDYPTMLIRAARGRIELADGNARAALEDLLDCGERLKRLRADTPAMLDWRGPAARAHLALGQNDAALALAMDNVERAQRLGGPIVVAEALRVLGFVRGTDGLTTLQEAADLAATTPSTISQARALVDLGAAIRRSGRPADSRDVLAQGLDLAERCGARLLADRVRDELQVAGGRPRRTRLSGPAALTPAELRVVRLAADGATNTGIAQRLFISRKTVEKHLASAYAKLGVGSRGDLADLTLP